MGWPRPATYTPSRSGIYDVSVKAVIAGRQIAAHTVFVIVMSALRCVNRLRTLRCRAVGGQLAEDLSF